MNREKQLAKNTAIIAIGKICTQFVSFFLLPLYTSLLSTEEYGTVDLLNTYISLLLPLVFFQIDQASFRFLIDSRKDKEEQNKIISTIIFTIFVQTIVYLIIFTLISPFIKNKYNFFLATNVVASCFSNIMLQISRGVGDNLTYSLGSLVAGVGTIVLNVLFIACFKFGAYGMLSATFIANIICMFFVLFKKKIYTSIKIRYFSKEELKKIWKYSIPLIPNQLSWWIVNASDRTIVSHVLGIASNGVYSASNKFSSICITFFNIFNITWAESASIYIREKDSSKYFSKIINIAIKLFTSLCLGIIAVMPFVFKYLITGESYETAYYHIPILMLSTIFSIIVSLLGSVYVALKKTNEIAKTSIYAAIINISVNLVLIKHIGLYAASISTLISYLAMSIYRFIDVQKYIKIKLEIWFILLSFVLSIFILSSYYYRNILISICVLVITVIIALAINKDLLISMVNLVLLKFRRNNKDIKIIKDELPIRVGSDDINLN